MGSFLKRVLLAGLAIAALSNCSFDKPAYPAFRDEPGSVNSIEMAWPDGSGMGAFVDSIDASRQGAVSGLKYRLRVVFDTGFTTTVVQDASVALHVGDRVAIEGGRAVPRAAAETDPKRNLAHF